MVVKNVLLRDLVEHWLIKYMSRVVTKLVGTGRARPALTKSDQQGREKTKNDQQKNQKKPDWHASSKIG